MVIPSNSIISVEKLLMDFPSEGLSMEPTWQLHKLVFTVKSIELHCVYIPCDVFYEKPQAEETIIISFGTL